MAAPRTQLATFADLLALPDDVRAEIIHGAIVEKGERYSRARGLATRHRWNAAALVSATAGGRWPGGWWSGAEIEVEYEAHEVPP